MVSDPKSPLRASVAPCLRVKKGIKEGRRRSVGVQKEWSFPFGLKGEEAGIKMTTHRECRSSMVFNTEARRKTVKIDSRG